MPKILPKADQIASAWLEEAKNVVEGAETFLPADTKQEAKALVKKLRELRDKMSRDEPILASMLDITQVFRDSRHWVSIRKKMSSPLVGYVKLPSGKVEKKTVAFDPDRRRKIKLMVQDGMPLEEMNAALGQALSPAEIREFIEKGRFS